MKTPKQLTATPITGEPPERREQVRINYYEQARHFEIAAYTLHKANATTVNEFPKDFMMGIPLVVNHAFALELYLKCLLQIEDKLGHGHDLDLLFCALEPDHQSRIEEAYTAAWHRSSEPGMNIRDILGRCKDAFSEWRYLNEGKVSKTGGIYDAFLVLHHVRRIIWEDVPRLKSILPLLVGEP